MNATAFDAPPPGPGLITVTFGVPPVVKSAAGMVTTICVDVIVVGVSAGFEPNVTVAPATNLVPLIVSAKEAPPAFALAGESGGVIAGIGLLLVKAKFTVVKPVAPAVTVYGPPAVAFAVNGADATPDAFVASVIVAVLLLKTPEAPEPGAVNVTFTPLTGLLPESFTVTAKALANTVLIVADCGVAPALAVIVVGAPTLFVSEKLTVVSPVAAAVTV